MAAPPGFAPPPGFGASSAGPSSQLPRQQQPNGNYNPNANMNGMEGDFFGQLSAEEIQKKARKWRTSQKKRFNEKRRRGGGAGVDMGKAVSNLASILCGSMVAPMTGRARETGWDG